MIIIIIIIIIIISASLALFGAQSNYFARFVVQVPINQEDPTGSQLGLNSSATTRRRQRRMYAHMQSICWRIQ